MKHLTDMVEQHKRGNTNGIYAVCSAHPLVLEAAIRCAHSQQTPLLIEATSNQVDQFGGYTGMTPADFYGFVRKLADSLGFPASQLILGDDRVGQRNRIILAGHTAVEVDLFEPGCDIAFNKIVSIGHRFLRGQVLPAVWP